MQLRFDGFVRLNNHWFSSRIQFEKLNLFSCVVLDSPEARVNDIVSLTIKLPSNRVKPSSSIGAPMESEFFSEDVQEQDLRVPTEEEMREDFRELLAKEGLTPRHFRDSSILEDEPLINLSDTDMNQDQLAVAGTNPEKESAAKTNTSVPAKSNVKNTEKQNPVTSKKKRRIIPQLVKANHRHSALYMQVRSRIKQGLRPGQRLIQRNWDKNPKNGKIRFFRTPSPSPSSSDGEDRSDSTSGVELIIPDIS